MSLATEKLLTIADGGQVQHLTHEGLLEFHQGDSWFGLSVGFRAMQLAGSVLSRERLWDRQQLYVESGHPGPGVRDAIEYVTRCVSRKRFCLTKPKEARIDQHSRHAGANRHSASHKSDWIPASAGMTVGEVCLDQALSRSAFQCSCDMRFEWRVSDGRRLAEVRLRSGFVPEAFFDLLDRRGTEQERPDDRQRFDDLKRELSERLWELSLDSAFEISTECAKVASHA